MRADQVGSATGGVGLAAIGGGALVLGGVEGGGGRRGRGWCGAVMN